MKYFLFLFLPVLCWSAPDWNQILNGVNVSQVVVVTSNSGVQAEVRLFEKTNGVWKEIQNYPGVIGLSGFAEPGKKQEGDKKTPTGIYGFVTAWGYTPKAETKMPYRQVDEDDKLIDDVNSPDYNRWIHGPTDAKSFEKMKRKDGLYELGLVTDYNTNPVEKAKGSAIFLHVWRSAQKGTMGCVAIAKENMIQLLKWLDPSNTPKIILNPSLK